MKPHPRLDPKNRSERSFAKNLPRALARDLQRILGAAGFIQEAERLLAYESDALTRVRGTPLAVLIPGTRRELRFAVRSLYEAGIPFVPRGMGTGLTGGAVADRSVIVSTARLDRLLRLDSDERLAIVEPGVITEEISRRAGRVGLRYLPDPGSASACTIGGNVATNAGGPHCLRHGVTADHVLGLDVLLAHGEELTLDRGESGGLDLAGLFTGSEGTFGIATAITVRLEPVAEVRRTALVLFDQIGDAGLAVTSILAAGSLPVALEIIDRTTIRVVEESPFAAGLPTDAGAALVVECEGSREEADEEMSAALAAVRLAGAREVRTADTEAERDRLWQARKKAFGALGRLGPDVLIEDAVVPRTTLPDLLTRIESVAERHALPLANFFHAGDGNLHPNIVFDVSDADQAERVESARREILGMCIEAGGTITGEHGVGLDKLKSMPLILGRQELNILQAVRRAFDPEDRCNPGKAVPSPDRKGAIGLRTTKPAASERYEELRRLITSRSPGTALVATGAPSATPGPDLEENAGVHLVSTAGLNGVVDYRRDDLTVTVGAGTRMSDVLSELAAEGQWIPVEGSALHLSIGGLIAAAPPTAFDSRFGPVRRQLLGVETISPAGVRHRWGRPVMKNVAGYDLVRLNCGGFGRLGVICQASFRLWPLPSRPRRLMARGSAARELLERLVREEALSDLDGTRWTRSSDPAGVHDELTVWLSGSERSVATRSERLTETAAAVGCQLQELPGVWDLPFPETIRPARDGRCSLRIKTSSRDFFVWSNRISAILSAHTFSLVGLPATKMLLIDFQRSEAEVPELLDTIIEACDGAAFALERGSRKEHESVDARRPTLPRQLEDSIVAGCGGQPRCWQADYV